jgi:hypothetical protein
MPAASSSPVDPVFCHLFAAADGLDGDRATVLSVLAAVADPRARRGVRHRLAVILALAVCAVLAGARSFTAIAEWAADTDEATRAGLGIGGAVPCESTIRRTLQRLDADAFDDLAGAWAQQRTAPSAGRRRVVAVDGKTLRGSATGTRPGRHLLAALDHDRGVVLGQVDVEVKTNEVRHEALCRIPYSVRRNSEGYSWARWLTWIRKVKGTGACHEYRRSCPDARSDAPGSPRDMAKAVLPESQSPVMQVFIHRKQHLKPVPRSAPGYLVVRCNFRDADDAQ